MNVEDLTNELWTRIMLETLDMDSDTKYVVRGVVQSVIHDMKEAHKDESCN
jgi:hypothetical protein